LRDPTCSMCMGGCLAPMQTGGIPFSVIRRRWATMLGGPRGRPRKGAPKCDNTGCAWRATTRSHAPGSFAERKLSRSGRLESPVWADPPGPLLHRHSMARERRYVSVIEECKWLRLQSQGLIRNHY